MSDEKLNEPRINSTYEIMSLSKNKYNEEVKREKSITNQANFYMLTIAILIISLINVIDTKNRIYILILISLLMFSFIFALLSTWRHKRCFHPKAKDMIDSYNEILSELEYDIDSYFYKSNILVINMYDDLNDSLVKANDKKTKTLILSFLLFMFSIILALVFMVVLAVI